jgi:hypothetical protein
LSKVKNPTLNKVKQGGKMKIIITIFLVLISMLSLFSQIDENALKIYNETFDRAIYTFALAKGLNGVISVLQSSEINLSFFIGATVGIGQILDPLNDLIERFSIIMLISSVSLGIQYLLIILSKSALIKSLLAFSSIAIVIVLWINKFDKSAIFKITLKIFLLLIILRFGAVVFIQTNDYLYTEIYKNNYEVSSKYINNFTSDLKSIKQDQNLKNSFIVVENKSETFTKEIIKTITFFVITTILFPIIFIFFLLFLLKLLFNIKIEEELINKIFKK